jgi:hypothetical protein
VLPFFSSSPTAPRSLSRWAELLSWFTRRLADTCPAYLDIDGGTDAVDLIATLYRKWAERHGFPCRLVHDEPGRPHVTLAIDAPFAFGWLRGEMGLHRLTRTDEQEVSVRVWPDVEGLTVARWDVRLIRIESIPHRDARGVG